MSKADELKRQVPAFLLSSTEFVQAYEAQGLKLDEIEAAKSDLLDQLFIDTATWGLKYWEEFTGIPTDESLSYATRRAAVKAKTAGYGTLTKATLENIFSQYGITDVVIDESGEPYVIKTHSDIEADDDVIRSMNAILAEIFPAHLNMVSTYTTQDINYDYKYGDVKNVDLYASVAKYQEPLFSGMLSPEVQTVLSFQVTGRKSGSSSGTRVVIDRIVANTDPNYWIPVPVTSGDITLGSYWSVGNFAPDQVYYTGAIKTVLSAINSFSGRTVSYAFIGTAVSVQFDTGYSGGIAEVYLDGVLHGIADTYCDDNTAHNGGFDYNGDSNLKYIIDGLEEGPHVVAVKTTATKNPASLQAIENTSIRIDRFYYRSESESVVIDFTAAPAGWSLESDARHYNGSALTSTTQAAEYTAYISNCSNYTVYGYKGPDCGIVKVNVSGYTSDYVTPLKQTDLNSVTSDNRLLEVETTTSDGTVKKRSLDTGDTIWTANVNGNLGENGQIRGACEDGDGNLYFLTDAASTGMYVVKYDKAGTYIGKSVELSQQPYHELCWDGVNHVLLTRLQEAYSAVKLMSIAPDTLIGTVHTLTGTSIKDLVGASGGYIYTVETRADVKDYLVKYSSAFIELGKVEITAAIRRFYLSDDRIYMAYGTAGNAATDYQGVSGPMVMAWNLDLVAVMAAKSSPVGIYFNVSQTDGSVYGMKGSIYKTQTAVTRLNPDFTEDWTAVMGVRNLADYSSTGANHAYITYDGKKVYRLGNKKVLGYYKQFELFE